MSGEKSTSRAKLKAASQKERPCKWKEYFKNLLRNPPEITDKLIQKIIYSQLDVKQEQFTILKKIKNRKAAGLVKILPEV